MAPANEALFPCDRFPEEPAAARLLGLYDQQQEGLLMQRVKIHAGIIHTRPLKADCRI